MVVPLFKILSQQRFSVQNEKETQAEIADTLHRHNIKFSREHRLNEQSIPDFFIDGIVLEVKIKGNSKQIYRQCERYCQIEEVKSLILVTNRSMGFPKEINNKPCYILQLGKSWL